MARTNADCGFWVSDLLQIAPKDRVLEVGFGPGVVTERLAKLAPAGRVAGVDQSIEMVELARAHNITAIQKGRVDLQWGSVESLPFGDSTFDKALAINSMAPLKAYSRGVNRGSWDRVKSNMRSPFFN